MKFLVLFHDTWEPTPEIQQAWQDWFARVGDRFIDSGNPFTGGVEVTHAGSRELSASDGVATGSRSSPPIAARLQRLCSRDARTCRASDSTKPRPCDLVTPTPREQRDSRSGSGRA